VLALEVPGQIEGFALEKSRSYTCVIGGNRLVFQCQRRVEKGHIGVARTSLRCFSQMAQTGADAGHKAHVQDRPPGKRQGAQAAMDFCIIAHEGFPFAVGVAAASARASSARRGLPRLTAARQSSIALSRSCPPSAFAAASC
jgi:hypothetical protein